MKYFDYEEWFEGFERELREIFAISWNRKARVEDIVKFYRKAVLGEWSVLISISVDSLDHLSMMRQSAKENNVNWGNKNEVCWLQTLQKTW